MSELKFGGSALMGFNAVERDTEHEPEAKQLSAAQLSSPAALEKRHYPFRNYRHAAPITLFPGCNFLAIYPETTRKLATLLKQMCDAGIVYDCCSQPVLEMGLKEEADQISDQLEQRLLRKGVQTIVTVCPNCHYRMKSTFTKIDIVDIYSFLKEQGFCGPKLESMPLWQPCPDRRTGEMLASLSEHLYDQPEVSRPVPCCGLKGWGRIYSPEKADRFATTLAQSGPLRTYCASCVMAVNRHGGRDMHHALVDLLETNESPDVSHSLANRAKARWA